MSGRGREGVRLHLVRHADAGDPSVWRGPDDERPLSGKGRHQAERLGRLLAAAGFAPDAVISSPKLRAAQTAELLAEALGSRVTIDERLASDAGIGEIERVLADAGDPIRPVLVGHDPDFTELLGLLCGTANVPMKKGALARIDLNRPLEPGSGTLRWLIPPDALGNDR